MGTVYQQSPSEMQRHESMGFIRGAPVAMTSLQHPPPPPVRPKLSDLRSIKRNLFDDSPRVGEISQMLEARQREHIDSVNNRLKIDLWNCNQKISALNKCESDSGDALPNTRPQGIKRTFRVRKANTAISNVPKRIRDNLSSEMGMNRQKETEEKEKVEAKKKPEEETKKETEGEVEPKKETVGEPKKETKHLETKVQQQKEQQNEQQNGEEPEDKQRQ